MSKPRIMRLETRGPADTGMPELPPIDPGTLTAGEPVQRGHEYLNDPANKLTSGVWDCTPVTLKPAPYDVNEFMYVLEGSVTIVDERGGEETIRAGEAFIIPKGMPCVWKQDEYIRKFYVIFDDASGKTPADPSSLAVIRPRPEGPAGGLVPVRIDPSAAYVGDAPTQQNHTYFADMTAQMTVGLWDSTPFERPVAPFPRHELMHLLEGSVTLTDGDGAEHHFKAGDTLLVPKGADLGWRSTEYVRKFYCIFLENEAAARASAAE